MEEDRIIRYIQISGIVIFYAFVMGVVLFLINGIRNGWIYRNSSASYEFSFSFAIIISILVFLVFSVLIYVVSVVFWRLSKQE
ncbi:MAG: hypothetical protein OHK0032_13680 [Thermodesulfovibrionales bacterium]